MRLGDGVGEAIAEVQLRGMTATLTVTGERFQRGFSLVTGDGDRSDARCGEEIAIGEVIGARASSSASARASASASRVRMATIADASTNIRARR